jgi:hypothetical protein
MTAAGLAPCDRGVFSDVLREREIAARAGLHGEHRPLGARPLATMCRPLAKIGVGAVSFELPPKLP